MPLEPKSVHVFEQFGALLRELALVLAQYRRELETQGVPAAEAFALTQRMEERLSGPMFDRLASMRIAEKDTDPLE